jgi:branched-subunit amino acid transport protein
MTNEWMMILGMAIVTFSVRYPVMAVVGYLQLPPAMLRALKYVPTAVLTAIIVPAVLIADGKLNLSINNAQLIGSIVATVIAWRTKNLLWTIVGGMVAFGLWRVLTG